MGAASTTSHYAKEEEEDEEEDEEEEEEQEEAVVAAAVETATQWQRRWRRQRRRRRTRRRRQQRRRRRRDGGHADGGDGGEGGDGDGGDGGGHVDGGGGNGGVDDGGDEGDDVGDGGGDGGGGTSATTATAAETAAAAAIAKRIFGPAHVATPFLCRLSRPGRSYFSGRASPATKFSTYFSSRGGAVDLFGLFRRACRWPLVVRSILRLSPLRTRQPIFRSVCRHLSDARSFGGVAASRSSGQLWSRLPQSWPKLNFAHAWPTPPTSSQGRCLHRDRCSCCATSTSSGRDCQNLARC